MRRRLQLLEIAVAQQLIRSRVTPRRGLPEVLDRVIGPSRGKREQSCGDRRYLTGRGPTTAAQK